MNILPHFFRFLFLIFFLFLFNLKDRSGFIERDELEQFAADLIRKQGVVSFNNKTLYHI